MDDTEKGKGKRKVLEEGAGKERYKETKEHEIKDCESRNFPGVLVTKTPCSQYTGPRFNPWSGN